MKSFYEDDKALRDTLRKGVAPDKPLRKQFICDEVKAVDTENLLVDFTISTDSVDRYGDVVEASGWDLKNYKRNPVILFAHDSVSPPIAKCIPKSLKIENGKLKATAQFMPRDLYDFSFMIFSMYQKGFMKATSVGFRPLEWAFSEDKNREMGVDFTKQELLEFSCVPVPANPEALMEAKSMGIELNPLRIWAEKTLDSWEKHKGILLPREIVEKVYKNSKTIKSFERKATMETLAKFEIENDKIKSTSAVTGEFVKSENKHALVLTKGSDSTISIQDITLDDAKEVLTDALKADKTISGYVLEVGVKKDTTDQVFKRVFEIKADASDGVDNSEPAYTTTCPGCGQLVQVEASNAVCPLCGYEGLTRPAKAGEVPVTKTVETLEIKVTLEDTLKSFFKFIDNKEVIEKNANDLIEVYLALGDVLLDAKEANPDIFKSRKSVRMLDQIKTQSKSILDALDLNDNNGKKEENEEVFELIEDVVNAKSDDDFLTIEEAQELLKDVLPDLEKKLEDNISKGTTELLNKLRGRVE